MDFNDIKLRVERMYAAVNEQYDYEVQKHINTRIIDVGGKHRETRITFGNNTKVEVFNKIYSVVYAIAGLKDHLKNTMSKNGYDAKDAERLIDGSLELCLIVDLCNKDKHGEPLTRPERSGRNPKIANIEQGISSDEPGTFSMTFDGNTGDMISKEGSPKIVIIGDVVDGNTGQTIMSLEDIFSKAIAKIEKFMSENRIIESSY